MSIIVICVLISSLSFYAYVASYFLSPNMKNEFKRFNLEKLGLFIITLEFLGATGLIVGLFLNPILIISSLGLGLLMIFGLIVRLKLKDTLWISLPAIFYICLNLYIFIASVKWGFKSKNQCLTLFDFLLLSDFQQNFLNLIYASTGRNRIWSIGTIG